MVLKTRIQVFSFPKDPKLLFYFDTKENPKGKTVLLISRQQSMCTLGIDILVEGMCQYWNFIFIYFRL